MSNLEIFGVFPTPIAVIDSGNKFSKENDKLISDIKYIDNGHTYNDEVSYDTSESAYILDSENVPVLREFILKHVHEYSKILLGNDDELNFTQSWIVKHSGKQDVFMHRHTNSVISGSYYIQSSKSDANLRFHDDRRTGSIGLPTITPTIKNDLRNEFNSETAEMESITGRLILFPSWIQHSVSGELTDNVINRHVLAFNTFWPSPDWL